MSQEGSGVGGFGVVAVGLERLNYKFLFDTTPLYPMKCTLPLLVISSAVMSFAQTPTLAQLNVVCDGKSGYQRLTNWSSGPTGFGGYYQTEFCGRLLTSANGQSEFVVELNGKDGSGAGIFSMNCSNAPKGYWKSNPDFRGISGAEKEKRLSSALQRASRIYC